MRAQWSVCDPFTQLERRRDRWSLTHQQKISIFAWRYYSQTPKVDCFSVLLKVPRGIKEGRQDRNYKKRPAIKKTFPHQTRIITRQCHPEDDGKNLTSSCVYQKPKALPWSDCVVSFQSAFEFSEKKKLVAGAWGPPENTSTDLRKLKRHLPKVVTQLGL